MAKKKYTGIEVAEVQIAPGYDAEDFEAKLVGLGATVIPFPAFINTGAQFAVNEPNDSFLIDVSLRTSVNIMQNGQVIQYNNTIYQGVIVRKKGKEYYVMGKDGILVKTVVE